MRLMTLLVAVVLAATSSVTAQPPPPGGGAINISYVEAQHTVGLPTVYPVFSGVATIPASHLPTITEIGTAGNYTAHAAGSTWNGVKVDLSVSYWMFDGGFVTACGSGSGTWDTSGIDWLNANGQRVWQLQVGLWQEKWHTGGGFWAWELIATDAIQIQIDPNS